MHKGERIIDDKRLLEGARFTHWRGDTRNVLGIGWHCCTVSATKSPV